MTDTTSITQTKTVAEIVTAHPECARIFEHHRIDFCCRGNVPVAAACTERGLDVEAVLMQLESAVTERAGETRTRDFPAMSTTALVGYIVGTHHEYLRRCLPWIRQMADKVGRVHGEHDPRLVELARTVQRLGDALDPHLDEEEQVLFPALMALAPDPAVVGSGLRAMQDEHLDVGALLEHIQNLTDGFSVPDWACGTYRTLLAELRSLEGDIFRHVHLENHVLAPRFGATLG